MYGRYCAFTSTAQTDGRLFHLVVSLGAEHMHSVPYASTTTSQWVTILSQTPVHVHSTLSCHALRRAGHYTTLGNSTVKYTGPHGVHTNSPRQEAPFAVKGFRSKPGKSTPCTSCRKPHSRPRRKNDAPHQARQHQRGQCHPTAA